MRIHCTVAAVTLAVLAAPLVAGAQGAAGASTNPAHMTVFMRGVPVGTEDVSVTRTADGTVITGTSRVGPPVNLTLRRAEVRYAPDGRPLDCTVEGSVGDELLGMHTSVSGGTATTDATQGLATGRRVEQIDPNALLLPNVFFSSYEALAARLATLKPGDQLAAFSPPQTRFAIEIVSSAQERVRTPSALVDVRRFGVRILDPKQPFEAEVWADADGRLLRLIIPSHSLDVARTDIVSVASRRERVSHPGDEQVSIVANGFNLAGTLSRPPGTQPPTGKAKPARLPAIVLVPAPGERDRDEVVSGVPVYGQLASALADAGYLVVRYDKRGTGQSGGRAESATLGDYAEDVKAVVRHLGKQRKDVDSKHIAVLGYAEGGAVALTAAASDGDVTAVVLVDAPGVKGSDLVLEQQRRALDAIKMSEADKQAKIDLQKKINQAALTGKGWEGIPPAMRRQAETGWFQSFLAYDPARVMRDVRQPVLIVQAALDGRIPPANAQKLEAMARARKKQGDKVKRVEVPGIDHALVPAVNEPSAGADKTVSNAVPAAVAGWLKEVWAPAAK